MNINIQATTPTCRLVLDFHGQNRLFCVYFSFQFWQSNYVVSYFFACFFKFAQSNYVYDRSGWIMYVFWSHFILLADPKCNKCLATSFKIFLQVKVFYQELIENKRTSVTQDGRRKVVKVSFYFKIFCLNEDDSM